jgi:hypothetical protein
MSHRVNALVRVGFYLAVLVLATVRWQLNPPLQPLVLGILAMWFVTAGLFHWLRPQQTPPGLLPFHLDFAFFFYEVIAVLTASLLAILACVGIAVLEAVERLPHDPFYSVGDPLYREPLYVITLLVLASVFLVGLPALFGQIPTNRQPPR